MRFFLILVFIVVISFIIFKSQDEIVNTTARVSNVTSYSTDSRESYDFFDFVWDAISFIFKGSILGVLIWGAKLYFDNE